MTSKTINTLLADIDSLFEGPHKVNEKNLEEFKEAAGEALRASLEEAGVSRPFELRMSNIGTPDRKLWYQSRTDKAWIPQPRDARKFLIGHLLEALALFLVKESGHTVENEQREVDIDGIKGHIDCTVDGVVVDVKSASTYSFDKFSSGRILEDDPFGYLHQLSGYYETVPTESTEAGWLVVEKQDGRLNLVTYEHFELPSAKERIQHVKEMLQKDTPPEKCYEPKEDKHGNLELPKGCQWCPFKADCWPEMRVFRYSTNDAFYVHVEKMPRVKEVTEEYFNNG